MRVFRPTAGRRCPLLILFVTTATLSGCTNPLSPNTQGLPTGLPSYPPGQWTKLKSTCPNLDGKASQSLGIGAEGRPTESYRADFRGYHATCQWNSDTFKGISVDVEVEIRDMDTIKRLWEISEMAATEIPGLGDEAVRKPSMSTSVDTRSKNAIIRVKINLPDYPADAANAHLTRLDELEPAAIDITKEVFDDLQ